MKKLNKLFFFIILLEEMDYLTQDDIDEISEIDNVKLKDNKMEFKNNNIKIKIKFYNGEEDDINLSHEIIEAILKRANSTIKFEKYKELYLNEIKNIFNNVNNNDKIFIFDYVFNIKCIATNHCIYTSYHDTEMYNYINKPGDSLYYLSKKGLSKLESIKKEIKKEMELYDYYKEIVDRYFSSVKNNITMVTNKDRFIVKNNKYNIYFDIDGDKINQICLCQYESCIIIFDEILEFDKNNVDLMLNKIDDMIELIESTLKGYSYRPINSILKVPNNIDIENLKSLLDKCQLITKTFDNSKIGNYGRYNVKYENDMFFLSEYGGVKFSTNFFDELVEFCKMKYSDILKQNI